MIPLTSSRRRTKGFRVLVFLIVLYSLSFQKYAFAKQESKPEQTVISGAKIDDPSSPSLTRPSHWAAPLNKPGLPNLHKVSKDLYRGAQPDAAGFQELQAMGIKTIINLRSYHSDRSLLKGTRLDYIPIETQAWRIEESETVKFLKVVTDKNRTPVFVHCQHGADRTGTLCAIYRMAVSGWSREEAISEMTNGGFGYHKVWKNLIHYLNALDMEKIKKKAGLSPTP